MNFNIIELFAGIGGNRLGFEQASSDFKVVYANDIESKCKTTYECNFTNNSHFVLQDLNTVDLSTLPQADIVSSSFPCQSFSIAGNRTGLSDIRGSLFFRTMEVINYVKPACVFLENVKNLAKMDKGAVLKIILDKLTESGYYVKYYILDAANYGVPQHRERIYIVGFRDKSITDTFNITCPSHNVSPFDIIDISQKKDDKYYYTNATEIGRRVCAEVHHGSVFQWRRKYVRENKGGVCPTLTANMGCGGHNVPIIRDNFGVRKLLPYECFLIQGFPSTYKLPAVSDSTLYKQIGNSVCVPVISEIAKAIHVSLFASKVISMSSNLELLSLVNPTAITVETSTILNTE